MGTGRQVEPVFSLDGISQVALLPPGLRRSSPTYHLDLIGKITQTKPFCSTLLVTKQIEIKQVRKCALNAFSK